MTQTLALLLAGPLVGIELGVAAVINPLADRLPDSGYRIVRSGGGKWLGALMPFWYIGTFVVLVVLAVGSRAAIVPVVLMGLALLLTVTILVPINNRVSKWATDADVDRSLASRWDRFHWIRVGLLAAMFVVLAVWAR
jgi:hypothetical protein